MGQHILMGETATFRLALLVLFVTVSAVVGLVAGLVWLCAREDRRG